MTWGLVAALAVIVGLIYWPVQTLLLLVLALLLARPIARWANDTIAGR